MLLTVPVKKCVRRFLMKEFGREPIAVRANSDLGGILLLAFAKGEAIDPDQLNVTEAELPDGPGMTRIQFQLGDKFKRASLSPNAYVLLTNALMAYFRTSLYYYTSGRRTLFNSEMGAVKMFLKSYDIPEDELTEESAIKIAQRERKERSDFRTVRSGVSQLAA